MKVKIRRLNARQSAAAIERIATKAKAAADEAKVAAIVATEKFKRDIESYAACEEKDAAWRRWYELNERAEAAARKAEAAAKIQSAGRVDHVAAIEAVAAMCGVSANDMAGDIIPAILSATVAGVGVPVIRDVIWMTAAVK